MKNSKIRLIAPLALAVLLAALSCKSAPPAAETPPDEPQQTAADPNSQAPGQDALDKLNAAMARAESSRNAALEVQGDVYFPDDWEKAELHNEAGKNAKKDTLGGVNEAVASFIAAAEAYDTITENSGPLFAKDLDDARAALEAALARAEKSRGDALDNQGPSYFPDDWQAAEDLRQNGEDANKDTIDNIKAAEALFSAAADSYDEIAGKSRPLFAKEKDDANKALQAAMARADKSRQAAMDVNGQNYFPNDWKSAEDQLQSGKSAQKGTAEEINAAAALFASAADMYDALAGKSRPMFTKEKDDASKALQAAIARADKSRQAAMDANGQNYFPNDWKSAETKNASAKGAKRGTADEMKAATSLYAAAADAYDSIAKNSGPMLAKDKDDANKALQAAIARSEKSRKDASDGGGQANFPTEWKNAEAKNQTAKSAKRGTVAEMKAAAPLYNSAADAYDDIVSKNGELAKANAEKDRQAAEALAAAEKDRQTASDAKANADKERQSAIDAKAPVAVRDDFNSADEIYQQALTDFNAETFASAADGFNQSAPMFAQAAKDAEGKRGSAEDAVGKAKQSSADSITLATNIGLSMGDKNE